jgi:hypothetical protein
MTTRGPDKSKRKRRGKTDQEKASTAASKRRKNKEAARKGHAALFQPAAVRGAAADANAARMDVDSAGEHDERGGVDESARTAAMVDAAEIPPDDGAAAPPRVDPRMRYDDTREGALIDSENDGGKDVEPETRHAANFEAEEREGDGARAAAAVVATTIPANDGPAAPPRVEPPTNDGAAEPPSVEPRAEGNDSPLPVREEVHMLAINQYPRMAMTAKGSCRAAWSPCRATLTLRPSRELENDEDTNSDFDADNTADGPMALLLKAIHERLQKETTGKEPVVDRWLLNHLNANEFWIYARDAANFCERFELAYGEPSYYRDVKIWLPDVQWGKEFAPCCPICQRNNRVGVHGYQTNHHGRRIVRLRDHYFLISRRYICKVPRRGDGGEGKGQGGGRTCGGCKSLRLRRRRCAAVLLFLITKYLFCFLSSSATATTAASTCCCCTWHA